MIIGGEKNQIFSDFFQIHVRISAIFCPNLEHASSRQTRCGSRLPARNFGGGNVVSSSEGRHQANGDGAILFSVGRKWAVGRFWIIRFRLLDCVWNRFEMRRSFHDHFTHNRDDGLCIVTSESGTEEFSARYNTGQTGLCDHHHVGCDRSGVYYFTGSFYDHVGYIRIKAHVPTVAHYAELHFRFSHYSESNLQFLHLFRHRKRVPSSVEATFGL